MTDRRIESNSDDNKIVGLLQLPDSAPRPVSSADAEIDACKAIFNRSGAPEVAGENTLSHGDADIAS